MLWWHLHGPEATRLSVPNVWIQRGRSGVNPRGPSCLGRSSRSSGVCRLYCLIRQIFVRHILCTGFNYFLNLYNDTWQEKRKPEPRGQENPAMCFNSTRKIHKKFCQSSQLITITPERKYKFHRNQFYLLPSADLFTPLLPLERTRRA